MQTLLPGRSYITARVDETIIGAKKFHPLDVLRVTSVDFGVKEARELITQAYGRPYGEMRVLVVHDADQLSHQVQSTFLKILEEPPNYLVIIFEAKNKESFLPTVQSRLHSLQVTFEAENEVEEQLNLSDVATIKTRPEVLDFLRKIRRQLRNRALLNPSSALLTNLEAVDRAVWRLEKNCNQKLVIDSLLLHSSLESGMEISNG